MTTCDGPVAENAILALQQQIGAYLAEPVEVRVHRMAGFEKDGLKFRPFVSKLRRAIDLHRADKLPGHRQQRSDDSAIGTA